MLIEIIKGAKRPNMSAFRAFVSNELPVFKLCKEIIETQASMKNIPIKNLVSSFSLKRKRKMMEVKMQYVAKRDVMMP